MEARADDEGGTGEAQGRMSEGMVETLSLGDPLVRALAVPLIASACGVGLIRFFLGEGRGAVLAHAGIGLGLLAGILAIFGLPHLPPYSFIDKVIYVVLAGLLVGALTDRFQVALPLAMVLLIGWPVLCLLWFVAPGLSQFPTSMALLQFGLLISGAVILFTRLDQVQDQGHHAALLLLWITATLAGVAHFYDMGRIAELSLAGTAAMAGYLLWNVPVSRYPLGHATILAVGSALIAVTTAVIAQENGAAVVLLAVFAMLFAHDIAKLVGLGQRGAVLAISAGAVLPAAVALGLAVYLTG
jgi:hypothetical protein